MGCQIFVCMVGYCIKYGHYKANGFSVPLDWVYRPHRLHASIDLSTRMSPIWLKNFVMASELSVFYACR